MLRKQQEEGASLWGPSSHVLVKLPTMATGSSLPATGRLSQHVTAGAKGLQPLRERPCSWAVISSLVGEEGLPFPRIPGRSQTYPVSQDCGAGLMQNIWSKRERGRFPVAGRVMLPDPLQRRLPPNAEKP